MRALLVLTILAAAVLAAPPRSHQLTKDYSFEQYRRDFGKAYDSPAELVAREAVFQGKLKKILAHNADGKQSYKMGVNHLTDRFPAEVKRLMGSRVIERSAETAALKKKPFVKEHQVSGQVLPKSVDWRLAVPPVLTAVKNQGDCGSCWTFGSTETLEAHWARATGILMDLSPQQLVSCAPNPNQCGGIGGCEGSTVELAWDYLTTKGQVATEWQYSYTSGNNGTTGACHASFGSLSPVKLHGYTHVTSNNAEAVMDALATIGPLAVNVAAMPWETYESGIFDGCAYNITVDHVVQLVGYGVDQVSGKKFWIVRNSWTPMWGEAGYIRLIRHDTPVCGWIVNPSQGTGCNGGPNQLWGCGQCGVLYDTLYPNVTP